MRIPGRSAVAGFSLSLIAGTAFAADVCARAPDLVALQIAALQQQLMVAALTCDDASLYNNFVTTYQKDLVASDEALQAFFDRLNDSDGAPAYHSFKTKMANLYSARSAADKKKFCVSVRASFAPALKAEKVSLASFAMSQPSPVNEPYTNCGDTVAGGAMVTSAPAATPLPPPSNVVIAQNSAAETKGSVALTAETPDRPLSAASAGESPASSDTQPYPPASPTPPEAVADNAANTTQQPNAANSARGPYYQGYGNGYARERERLPQQRASGQANPSGQGANSYPNQQRSAGLAERRYASEAYRERLAQQRAARQRAARQRANERAELRYRDRYDARGYFWPADPYWQYCFTRYGQRMTCAEAAQRFRADRFYYRAPYDAWSYPSR